MTSPRQTTIHNRRLVRRRGNESGYALLVVLLMASMIAIALYMAVPELLFEAQRDREQLLIDRGEQYSLAIRRFFMKTGRYPTTMEELEKFQGTRFLRRRYKDPMTSSGEWRIVHMNQAGMMTDSKTKPAVTAMAQTAGQQTSFGSLTGSTLGNSLAGTTPGQPNPTANPTDTADANQQQQQQQPIWARRNRTPGSAAGATDNGNTDMPPPDTNAMNGGQPPEAAMPPEAAIPNGQQQQPNAGFPAPPGFPPPATSDQQQAANGQPGINPNGQFPPSPSGLPFGNPGMNQQPGGSPAVNPAAQQIMNRLTSGQNAAGLQAPGGLGTPAGNPSPFGTPGTTPTTNGPFGANGAANSPFATAGGPMIAGVASKSDQKGIKTYNEKMKYSEWEFIFDFRKYMQQQQGGPQQATGQPLTPGGPGTSASGLSSTNSSTGLNSGQNTPTAAPTQNTNPGSSPNPTTGP